MMTLRNIILCASLVLTVVSWTSAQQRDPSDKPNIVLIMADDVGIECFGCYGSQQYKTPNLDRMAGQGIRFANCHSSPLCTPSRVKIMTGQSNIRNYHDFSILLPEEKTFAHMLRENGYKTAVAGKWQLLGAEHYGPMAGKGTHPTHAGFDEYCLWQIDKLGPRYWNPQLEKNGQPVTAGPDDYGPDLCADFICQFIEENKSRPFFVYYPMILPHNPFRPTPNSSDRSSKNKQQNFSDMVTHVDSLVGRILEQLDQSGLSRNTLVLFLADNGTNRNLTSTYQGREVKGGKSLTIDAGTHVPLIAYWKGVTPTGSVCHDLVDLSDFLPTIAELSGSQLPEEVTLDGISFASQLAGKPAANPRQWIYCYYNPRPGKKQFPKPIVFARDAQWKLYDDGRLFNVESDPLEQKVIAASDDTPVSVASRQKLRAAIKSMPNQPGKIK